MVLEYTETVFQVNGNYTVMDIPPRCCRREYTGMEFCANMKRLRLAKEWNQDELAERLGVAQPTVQRWENGKREPKFSDIERLAEVFEVPVSELFREGDVPAIPSEDELSQMIEAAMNELPVGVSYADYPTAVSSGLRDRLEQYQAAGGSHDSSAVAIARGKGAQSRETTRRAAAE